MKVRADGKAPHRARSKLCDGTDAARGVLASIVFISHFAYFFIGDISALGVAGSLSVLFFFAISGFVISASLIRHTAQDGAVDLIEFAKRRFFRIVPPLLATFLLIEALELTLVFGGFIGQGREAAGIYGYHLNLFKAAASLLTLGAINDLGGGLDGPLWSLAYEIRCYVTAALIAWLLTSRAPNRRKAMAVMFLCAYWFVALFIRSEGPLAQLPWLFSFAAGFFVFRYRSALDAMGWMGTASALVFSAVACVIMLNWREVTPGLGCVCGAAFAVLVLDLHGIAIKSRVLAALGATSYTLYIAHFPILLALYLMIKTAPAAMYVPLAAAAAVITAVACFALGRLVERSSAQLAWTERQLLRVRAAMAASQS
jgi:peptidoglycan/LPS O-acetylase OafA/YrhL